MAFGDSAGSWRLEARGRDIQLGSPTGHPRALVACLPLGLESGHAPELPLVLSPGQAQRRPQSSAERTSPLGYPTDISDWTHPK